MEGNTMIRLIIPGLPPSANAHRKGWRVDHRLKQGFSSVVSAAAIDAGVHGLNLGSNDRTLRMEVVFELGPKSRLSDVDNRLKALQDALQVAGVVSNDRHIRIFEAARVNGPTDRTLVKIFAVEAPTLGQVQDWWSLPDPLMEQTMGRLA